MEKIPQKIYVKLNNLNPLLLKTDVMDKLQEACDLAGEPESEQRILTV